MVQEDKPENALSW